MKKYLLLTALVLSMSASFAFKPDGTHLSGYIGDSMCGASKSGMASTETRMSCTKKCIKDGAAAVLVVGDKVYKIANQKVALKYAGKNVTVDGTITNDTITVTRITEDKAKS